MVKAFKGSPIYVLGVQTVSHRELAHKRNLILVTLAVVMLLIGVAIGVAISPRYVSETTTTIYTPVTHTATVYTSVTQVVTTKEPVQISVVDALGREVVLESVPRRVVSLAPSITEMLFALGLGDRVVGVTSFCNYPPEVPKLVSEGRISVIGGFWNPDPEKIVSLKPDLVIGSAGTRPHLQLKDLLEGAGIKVVYVYGSEADSFYDVVRDIRTIAKIFRVEETAEKLVSELEREIRSVVSTIANATSGSTKPKVLVLLGPPSFGLYSVGENTFIGWIILTVGGVNIAGKFSGWPVLDYEYILSNNPDIIIVSAMGSNYTELAKEIGTTPLAETKAYREGRVYLVDQEANDVLMRPGPRIASAVRLVASILYPELFGEPKIPVVYKVVEFVKPSS